MIQQVRNILAQGFQGIIREDEPLSEHTSFRIGGPADLWLEPENLESLQAALKAVVDQAVRYFLIGDGSNLVVSDNGFRGVIIRLGGGFRQIDYQGSSLISGAAVSLKDLTQEAQRRGLEGIAPLCGIPGSVGGGIIMNAGAYGADLADTLEWVEVIDPGKAPVRMVKSQITFGYRQAVELQGKVVTALCLQLQPGSPDDIQAEMDRVDGLRAQSQPLEFPSAGSVFKRPPGDYAGRVLEAVGAKGMTIGGAQVSTKHANFIINRGDAKAADVLALIRELRKRVRNEFGIELEQEIRQVGFGKEEERS